MIRNRADAMLEDMDEARHEGKYRQIEGSANFCAPSEAQCSQA